MGYRSLSEWAEATGQEMLMGRMTGIQEDPQFNGPLFPAVTDPYGLVAMRRYFLRPESPLKDKGTDIRKFSSGELPGSDFFGNPVPRGKGTEPGIYEMD